MDSQLAAMRQALAAAYVKQAEYGVTRGDVAGIRADSDAAERHQAASLDRNRLRAEAFRLEGDQKQKTGDLAGALSSFEEALKLNSGLGLKTECAVLHAQLGKRKFGFGGLGGRDDWRAAATYLDAAVALDKSAVEVVELAASVATGVIRAFEQNTSASNRTEALAALARLESLDAQFGRLPLLRKRVVAALLKRGESLAHSDPDSALTDYETALSLGADASDPASLKVHVTSLATRCRNLLRIRDGAKAAADYVALVKLDKQAARSLVAEFDKFPAPFLSQLPSSVLSQLPVRKNSLDMEFKLIPSGRFAMGEGSEDPERRAHQVTLTRSFELGVYEVTQAQYERVMGTNPSEFRGPQNPVEKVTWDDAVEFCRKLSKLPDEKVAGYVYRLPTEAEWEYACRAGTTTEYSFGDSGSQLVEFCWFGDNSGDQLIDTLDILINDKKNYRKRVLDNNCSTHAIGGKKPSPWGLYDMYGNVFEWCQDWYGDFPSGAVTDPTGPSLGSGRVYRGGCWGSSPQYARSANRLRDSPDLRYSDLGFRVLRSSIK